MSHHVLRQLTSLTLSTVNKKRKISSNTNSALSPALWGSTSLSPKAFEPEAAGIIYTVVVCDLCGGKHWIPTWHCGLATLPSPSELQFAFLPNGSHCYGAVLSVQQVSTWQ